MFSLPESGYPQHTATEIQQQREYIRYLNYRIGQLESQYISMQYTNAYNAAAALQEIKYWKDRLRQLEQWCSQPRRQ